MDEAPALAYFRADQRPYTSASVTDSLSGGGAMPPVVIVQSLLGFLCGGVVAQVPLNNVPAPIYVWHAHRVRPAALTWQAGDSPCTVRSSHKKYTCFLKNGCIEPEAGGIIALKYGLLLGACP